MTAIARGGRNAPSSCPASPALRMLAWVGRHGAGTVQNLAERFGAGPDAVEDVMRSLCREGLARRAGVLAGEPELFIATRAGLRRAGLGELRTCAVTPRAEAHLRVVASVAVWLEAAHDDHSQVLNERELEGATRRRRGRRTASPYVHFGDGFNKRPDLLVMPTTPAAGLPLAVEVELSRKSSAHLAAICRAWASCRGVAGVLYIAAPAVVRPLRRAVEDACAAARISIVELAPEDVPAVSRRALYRARPVAGCSPPPSSAHRTPRTVTGETDAELLALVRWAGRWGVVSPDSIALHRAVEHAHADELIARAERHGLLHCAAILRADGLSCWASRRGLTAAGLAHLRPVTVSYLSAANGHRDARIAALLERERPGSVAFGSREFGAAASDPDPSASGYPSLGDPSRIEAGGRCQAPCMVLASRADRAAPPTVVLAERGPRDHVALSRAIAVWRAHDGVGEVLVYVGIYRLHRVRARVGAQSDCGAAVTVRPLPAPGIG
ncbi:MAG: hypothetical protein ACYDA6_10330 [Solirubrobacteraceae bacterium]